MVSAILSSTDYTQNLDLVVENKVQQQFQVLKSSTFAIGDVVARSTADSVAGDSATQLASFVVAGENFSNTDSGKLYWKLTNSSTTRTVKLYKDSAMTAEVASGSRSGDGSVSLTASNSSGITATVTVTYSADDTDAANIITTDLINYAKYDATGSNQVVKGVCVGYNSTNGLLDLLIAGQVKFSKLNVTNATAKEDEIKEALQAVGIFAI